MFKVNDIIESNGIGIPERYQIVFIDNFYRLRNIETNNVICKFETIEQMTPYINGYKLIV